MSCEPQSLRWRCILLLLFPKALDQTNGMLILSLVHLWQVRLLFNPALFPLYPRLTSDVYSGARNVRQGKLGATVTTVAHVL